MRLLAALAWSRRAWLRPRDHVQGPPPVGLFANHRARGAGLTSREREVAVLLARGVSNRRVAEELIITEKTAKNHVQRVLQKLGVHSRAEVAARAAELGVLGT